MIRLLTSTLTVSVLTTTHRAYADLEVGTAFGANWVDVENQLKDEYFVSLANVRKNCASEAACSPSSLLRCGYDTTDENEFSPLVANEHSVRKRHNFDTQCQYPHFGDTCYLELCLGQCLEYRNKALSSECANAVAEAKICHEALHQMEDSDDARETIFRRAIPSLWVLSMLGSILGIYITKEAKSGNIDKTSDKLSKLCTILVLAWIIILFPLLLVVVAPPILLVNLAYFACLRERWGKEEREYYQVEVEERDFPIAFVGIPAQL
mmetsp:Transcript_28923/g.42888  ORF Transcript_28923/g.42888 Transcript_28923/m.42888 type:complete len:266 (+) Transcript_28923:28-825(+)